MLSKHRLSGATAESVFNSKVDEAVPHHQWAIERTGVCRGKTKSKRCVFKVMTEMAELTDNENFAPKRWSTRMKGSCVCVGLDPRDRRAHFSV